MAVSEIFDIRDLCQGEENVMKRLEQILEWGGTKRDIVFLVLWAPRS